MPGPYLIFDFDGVIGDTWEATIQTHQTMNPQLTRFELETRTHSYFANKPDHTRNHKKTEAEMAATHKWTADFGAIMQNTLITLFTDFVTQIENLSTEYKAIVSSGSQQYVIPALNKTSIKPTHILAFEDHHSKEEKIELICKDWGVKIADVYYFTDTLADVFELQDFISQDKLIGVSWGFCTKEQLGTQLPEDQILDKASDIHQVLPS